MPYPPHLFKPFDATDLKLSKSASLPVGPTDPWFTYTPPAGIVAVIKEINNTDTITDVLLWYLKNDVPIFIHGVGTAYPAESLRPNHFFEYLRENPITLTENDTFKVIVWNTTAGNQNIHFSAFGYVYPAERHYEKEQSVLK